jgi:hypothetical protein
LYIQTSSCGGSEHISVAGEYRISKENRDFDLDKKPIGLGVQVIRTVGAFIAQQYHTKLHNSKFLVRYSIFVFSINQFDQLA